MLLAETPLPQQQLRVAVVSSAPPPLVQQPVESVVEASQMCAITIVTRVAGGNTCRRSNDAPCCYCSSSGVGQKKTHSNFKYQISS